MSDSFRMYVTLPTGVSMRVQEHKTDSDLLVLKVRKGCEGLLDTFVEATGVDPEKKGSLVGSKHHLTFVTRAGAAKLFGALVAGIAQLELPFESASAATSEADAYDDENDDN